MADDTPRKLLLPRSTNSDLSVEVLGESEIRYNLDTGNAHIGDGVTPGGQPFVSLSEGSDAVEAIFGGRVTDLETETARLRFAAIASPDFAGREDIPTGERVFGLERTVATQFVDGPNSGPRYYRRSVWTSKNADGVTGWLGLKTEPELLDRGNHTNKQDQDTINGLPEALDDLDAADVNILKQVAAVAAGGAHVSSLSITPPTLPVGAAVNGAVAAWRVAGTPTGQYVEWKDGTYRAYLSPTARMARLQASAAKREKRREGRHNGR